MTVVLAGGSGGLGSASSSDLAGRRNFNLVISYKSNRAPSREACPTLADRASGSGIWKIDRQRYSMRRWIYTAWSSFSGDPARGTEPRSSIEAVVRIELPRPDASRSRSGGSHEVSGDGRGYRADLDDAGGVALHRVDGIRCAEGGPDSCGTGARERMPGQVEYSGKYDLSRCRIRQEWRRHSIASGKYAKYIDEDVICRYGRAEDVARAVRFFLEPDTTSQARC